MAEEDTLPDLEDLEKQLQSLINSLSSDDLRSDSRSFCSDLCKLVEEYTSRWKTPLPRLRILDKALCYFTRGSSSFTPSCDHVLHTLSSLALSVFEVLLFFDEQDFHKEPLKHFTVKIQEYIISLARYQNVHLLQVEPLVLAGGAWVSTTLKEILSDSNLPRNEVDRFLNSELPVFLALRVRYLISCERVSEALALARCCIRHPTAGKHLFFLQVYLTWLYKTERHQLLQEVACLNGKDAVHIICSLEYEEPNELLLALCQMFLSQQLCRGEMYYLWELIFVWSKLHDRLNTSKHAFLEECRQLMLSATNINSIFPFIKVVVQELGEAGIQFCVELCENALKSCPPNDTTTKLLIYKTIAGLLPNDLEVCRACALLVFFMERTVEAYKMVYLLYMLPDQDYHVEPIRIRNEIRFETLQVLKKDLYFDPEFWNLIALRTNCLKLMREKVVDAALEELVGETWIANYCAKGFSFVDSTSTGEDDKRTVKNPHHNNGRQKEMISEDKPERLKLGQGKTGLNDSNNGKKRGNHRSRCTKEASGQPLRRSFWQVDRIHDIASGQFRRVTRLSEKDPPKRRIQKPKWLLEDSGGPQDSKFRGRGLRHQKVHQSSALKRERECGQLKLGTQPKSPENSRTKQEKGFPLDTVEPASVPHVVLELSLPDNELSGTFNEEYNRQKVCIPMLFYKPTLKIPEPSHQVKVCHGKEVILRARDATMLVQLLHCYARRPKGKGNGASTHGSVSTITRSSALASPPKEIQMVLCEKANDETSDALNSKDAVATKHPEPPNTVLQLSAKECLEKIVEGVLDDESVKGAETPTVDEAAPSLSTDKVNTTVKSLELSSTSQSPAVYKVIEQPSTASIEFSQTGCSQIEGTEDTSPVTSTFSSQNPDSSHHVSLPSTAALNVHQQHPKELSSHSKIATHVANTQGVTCFAQSKPFTHTNNNSDLVTETLTHIPPVEIPQDMKNPEQTADAPTKESALQDKSNDKNVSSHTIPEAEYEEGNHRESPIEDDDLEDSDSIETEESKLESCCTFCQREFKGRRVVIHAMYHFRKDECMFCGTIFKDDLLAMMHLSDHIEKLKRSKELTTNKAQSNSTSETKDSHHPKTSAKAKASNRHSDHHMNRRPRIASICNNSISHPKPHIQSESRILRSNEKSAHSHLVQTNKPKVCNDRKSCHAKVNGHISKKTQFGQIKGTTSKALHGKTHTPCVTKDKAGNGKLNHVIPKRTDSFASSVQKKKRIECPEEDVINDTKKVSQKKVDCPADGCRWSTDLSKNRVSLLYHALEHHYGDIKPLKLSLKVAHNKCSICMRVLWSFEHFQHHVERHRLSPRHPCLHLGCTARFKTGNEMRRHARKHSPLQAVCCLPGCSKLFICLWALNLHEKEHYTSKPTKQVKSVDDKPSSLLVKTTTPSAEGILSEFTRKLRGHTTRDSTAKIVRDSSSPTLKTSLVKGKQKVRNQSKHRNVLKNVSNKEPTSSQSSNCTLNLRLRSGQTSNTNMMPTKRQLPFFPRRDNAKKKLVSRTRTEISSKRRSHPRKSKMKKHDKITTEVQVNQCRKDKPPDRVKMNEKHRHANDTGRISKMPDRRSKSQKSVSDNRSNRVDQKTSLDRHSSLRKASRDTVARAYRLRAHNLKKQRASTEKDSFDARGAKKKRITLRKSPRRIPALSAASKEPAKSTSTVAQKSRDDKEKIEKTHLSQDSPVECVSANAAVDTKKMLTDINESETMFHGQNNIGITISPDVENKLSKEPSNVAMDGSSSSTSELGIESNEEPSNVAMDGSSSTLSELGKESMEDPSNGTMDGSSSTLSELIKESMEEPSNESLDGSSCTTSQLEKKSNEELLNVTMEGSSSIMPELKNESKKGHLNLTIEDSTAILLKLKKVLSKKSSHVTRDGSSCSQSDLKRKSIEEPSNETSNSFSSSPNNLRTSEELSNETINASSSLMSKSKETSMTDHSNAASDDSTFTALTLKSEAKTEPLEMTSDGLDSTTSDSTTSDSTTSDSTTSDSTTSDSTTSDSTSSDLKKESKAEPSNMISVSSVSTTSNLKRKAKSELSNVASENSSFTQLKLKKKSNNTPPNGTNDAPSSTKSKIKEKSTKEPLKATSNSRESITPTSQGEETVPGPHSKLKIVCVRKAKAVQTNKDGTKKAIKKRPHPDKNTAIQVATESKSDVSKSGHVKVRRVEKCTGEKRLDSGKNPLSLKLTTAREPDKFALCIDTLAEYGKKHMRAPPTAYLNEWFTAMPKRRNTFQTPPDTTPEETWVPAAAPQRKRCANCFTTFNSSEELQSHLQMQRCSKLFGFDSDDEGNS
ncbi:uncharacterized protein LOC144199753 [Stigmatopora nigra]